MAELTDLTESIHNTIKDLQQRRTSIEQDWLSQYAAYSGWPDLRSAVRLPRGQVRYFIPWVRRAIERMVTRAVKLLMPTSEWPHVKALNRKSYDASARMHQYLYYLLRKKIKTRRVISALTRVTLLYDFPVLRTSALVHPSQEVWPSWRAVDPFSFYVFPETASTVDDCLMMCEEVFMPYEEYLSYVEAGICSKIKGALSTPQWPYHVVYRLAHKGIPSQGRMQGKRIFSEAQKQLNSQEQTFLHMFDVWLRKGAEWFNIWLVVSVKGVESGECIRVQNLGRRPLYQWTTHRPLPNEAYTASLCSDIRVLGILSNNTLSQTESARGIATKPPVAVNLDFAHKDEQYSYGDDNIWRFHGDARQAIQQMTVPDTSGAGLRMLQVYIALINTLSGMGTMAEGQPGRNMPRAGSAVKTLVDLALADIEDIAETIEIDLLTPGLSDIDFITHSLVPSWQMLQLPGVGEGGEPGEFTKEALTGDYTYDWLGTQQFQDKQLEGENLLGMLKVIGDPNILQMLQAQGVQVDVARLIELLWSSMLGEKDLSGVLKRLPNPQQVVQQNGSTMDMLSQLQSVRGKVPNGQ